MEMRVKIMKIKFKDIKETSKDFTYYVKIGLFHYFYIISAGYSVAVSIQALKFVRFYFLPTFEGLTSWQTVEHH